jgi:hypothetical protein
VSTRFVERNLLFEFGDRWTIFRWDTHPAYVKGMKESHKGKAVDFIGILDSREPFLIEATEHYEEEPSTCNEPPEIEFEKKVRCTVAALVGARCRGGPDDCVHFFNALIASRKPNAVLWLEEPPLGGMSYVVQQHLEASAGIMRDLIQKKMPWLKANTIVTNTFLEYQNDLPDLIVKRLPFERKKTVDAIIKKLSKRGVVLPEHLDRRIRTCLDQAELDRMLQRADHVRVASKLFGP